MSDLRVVVLCLALARNLLAPCGGGCAKNPDQELTGHDPCFCDTGRALSNGSQTARVAKTQTKHILGKKILVRIFTLDMLNKHGKFMFYSLKKHVFSIFFFEIKCSI
jgi:hypothetical protein